LERWLKEVNASNALPSGGCKVLNGRSDCSIAEIRLRWRANVSQPSTQSARPLLAEGRLEATGCSGSSDYRW
jgi:hypothetical protein